MEKSENESDISKSFLAEEMPMTYRIFSKLLEMQNQEGPTTPHNKVGKSSSFSKVCCTFKPCVIGDSRAFQESSFNLVKMWNPSQYL